MIATQSCSTIPPKACRCLCEKLAYFYGRRRQTTELLQECLFSALAIVHLLPLTLDRKANDLPER